MKGENRQVLRWLCMTPMRKAVLQVKSEKEHFECQMQEVILKQYPKAQEMLQKFAVLHLVFVPISRCYEPDMQGLGQES